MAKKTIFITWTTYSPHSLLLSRAFNSEIFYINNLINSRGIFWNLFFLFDYFYKSFKTIKVINEQKPDVVVMQNPPTITPLVIVLYSFIGKFKTVIDSHNGAFEKPWDTIPFYGWVLKNADIVLVHNEHLLSKLLQIKKYKGVNFKILNSRLSDYSHIKKSESDAQPYILVVTTFSGDEPMDILLKGIRMYNESENKVNIKFKITGKYSKRPHLFEEYKNDENIEFLGFIPTETYESLLVKAFGMISLSTRDDVQQFALMEAIGAEVPFISNNNKTNRQLFGDKMLLLNLTVEDMYRGITRFINLNETLRINVFQIKKTISLKWDSDFHQIVNNL